MTENEREREEQHFAEIQKERERLAISMEEEVQRVRAYIMFGTTITTEKKRT